MSSTTIRISVPARDLLRTLAARMNRSMQTVVEEALELYRRRCFLEEVNTAYATIRQDPQAWAEISEERALWDSTLADGLPEEEDG